MEHVSIKTGNLEIIAAGQVIIFSAETTEIVIRGIRMLFEFKDSDREKAHVETKNNELENTLNIIFWDFNDSLGLGNTKPIEIGTIEDKKIFFSYRIFTLDDKTLRTMEYTFYLG